MTATATGTDGEISTLTRSLRLFGLQLVLVVAATHLYWGLPKLVLYLRAGLIPDPRPPLFVVSSLVLLSGLVALYHGAPKRPIYVLGLLLVVGYLFGYVSWHLGDHGGFLPWIEGYGHFHGNPLSTVQAHLIGDPVGCTRASDGPACTPGSPLELLSKTAEALLAGILGYLLYTDS